jgi:hypothetical protein
LFSFPSLKWRRPEGERVKGEKREGEEVLEKGESREI